MTSYEAGPPLDEELIDVFVQHDGEPLEVRLSDGRRLIVHNIAWGYDAGDSYAHVTTNISPDVPGVSIDFFYTHELVDVRNEDGALVYRRS